MYNHEREQGADFLAIVLALAVIFAGLYGIAWLVSHWA